MLGLLVQKERVLGRELSESEISGQPQEPEKSGDHPPLKELPPAEPPKPPPPPPIPQSRSHWHFLLRAPEASVNFMTLPRVGRGIGLGVGIAYETWRVIVVGTYYMSQYDAAALNLYQVDYHRKFLELQGCHGWRSGSFEVAPCAVLSADDILAHASGDSLVSKDQRADWISIGSGISGYLHFQRHLALVVTGVGRIATNRVGFLVGTVTGVEQAHRVPWGALDASLGCEWIF